MNSACKHFLGEGRYLSPVNVYSDATKFYRKATLQGKGLWVWIVLKDHLRSSAQLWILEEHLRSESLEEITTKGQPSWNAKYLQYTLKDIGMEEK